jgi:hypothetical protein
MVQILGSSEANIYRGSRIIRKYVPHIHRRFVNAYVGRYLNGIDVDSEGALHVSWCYRDYVPVTLEESRAQAGPNGPENVSASDFINGR